MKRPTFLTIWLALMTLSAIYGLYSYTLGSANITKAIPNMPSWTLMLFTLLGLVNLISVFLLWTWKIMGFYLLIGTAVIAVVVNGAVLGGTGIATSIFALIGVGILYLAMKPAWQNFK